MFGYRFLLCVSLIVVCLRNVRSTLSKEDIQKLHESFEPIVEECLKKYNLEKEDFIEAKKNNDLSGIDSCFFSCLMTETEMLADGTFQDDKAKEKIKDYISDKDYATKMIDIIDQCTDEIGKDMGEGEEACKNAQLMVSCFEKHKFHMD